ncbi:hypothetical protein [Rhizobium sp. MHM7A]|uniref:hypothetical protein n=1 Tax=Rhizobium sp. MHM7A TaxID=2583233 RepID=UPI001106E38D|nr:hypothetical protein [Rhizobium sp. MHM7A]TLX16210.1 hypothetical protein FFR93_02465 [Rhizobium sp. MHM7A]
MEGVVMGEVSPEFTEINRSRAKAVKDRLERMGLTVTLGQAYEIVAVAHGHRNWPVMKSAAPAIMPKVRKGGNADHLCVCLDEMPPSQFVVMGSGKSLDVLSLSLLRRAQFRHSLD